MTVPTPWHFDHVVANRSVGQIGRPATIGQLCVDVVVAGAAYSNKRVIEDLH